ncbi:MAG: xanthine dehydrogenase family protein molybdopterin-binding subunit [Dehalococcoidia bacterium]|nr:xanthine dehydrogenase family protein molybdopterin-binding subunit [Dehalococcoidia bacterium]
MAQQPYIGSPILRKEDLRFLTGTARYVDDVKLPHMLHSAILRSPHAHARVVSIDSSAALEMEGVEAVYTFQDIVQTVEPRPIPMRRGSYSGLERFLQYPLAGEKVRYVGEPVAVVVAESRYLAEDALDAIEVKYEPLRAIVDVWGSRKGDVLLFEEHGTNLALEFEGSLGDADGAFAEAEYTRKEEFRCHRHTGNPLETRGLVASFAAGTGDMTVWGETKVAHFNRGVLASLLQMPEHRIHFIEPDVGGGFGIRGEFYPENFIVPFCSMKLGRPVKWIEDRMEHLIAANHSREHVCRLEIAATSDGVILGMRAEILGALGGYVRTHGASVPISVGAMLMGPYHIPNYRWRIESLLTNKVGMGTFSAPGRYESCFFRERMFDMVAADLGIDPVEMRLKNLIPASAMPYHVGVTRPDSPPMVYDSGDYQAVLEKALEMIDYREIRSVQGQLKDGKYHGVGIACFVKSTGGGVPFEGARIVVSGADQVAVYLGIATMGQGHETTMAQICAQGLGVPIDYVSVYHGSTDMMPYGGGTHASRGTIMAGNAVFKAAQELRQKILGISGAYLDIDPDELEFSLGKVRGKSDPEGETRLDLGQVLELASPSSRYNQGEMGLDVTSYFRSDEECFPCGAHAVHLTVDSETGKIEIERYVVAEDVGHVINPMILTGQIVGAAAQGIGATILEELVYDEGGQPLAGSLMDYLLPTSRDIPPIESAVVDLAPSPLNPLGVKGAGEIGIVATGAALSNAVSQALSSLGVQVRELPLSPDRLAQLIRDNHPAE